MLDSSMDIVVQKSAFLSKLPAEVRVNIYRECFRCLAVVWRTPRGYTGRGVEVTRWEYHDHSNIYRPSDSPAQRPFALIQVSRMVRQESLLIFRSMILHHLSAHNIAIFPMRHVLFDSSNVVNLSICGCDLSELNIPVMLRIFPQVKLLDVSLSVSVDLRRIGYDFRSKENFLSDSTLQEECFQRLEEHIRGWDLLSCLPTAPDSLMTMVSILNVQLYFKFSVKFRVSYNKHCALVVQR